MAWPDDALLLEVGRELGHTLRLLGWPNPLMLATTVAQHRFDDFGLEVSKDTDLERASLISEMKIRRGKPSNQGFAGIVCWPDFISGRGWPVRSDHLAAFAIRPGSR